MLETLSWSSTISSTSEGRQQNRRVELVVSSEVIGTKILSLNLQPIAAVMSPQ